MSYEKLRPTYTHEALVKLMDEGYLKYIISQNGDGLHGLSGVPKDKISELHGNVFIEMYVLFSCFSCICIITTYKRRYIKMILKPYYRIVTKDMALTIFYLRSE